MCKTGNCISFYDDMRIKFCSIVFFSENFALKFLSDIFCQNFSNYNESCSADKNCYCTIYLDSLYIKLSFRFIILNIFFLVSGTTLPTNVSKR